MSNDPRGNSRGVTALAAFVLVGGLALLGVESCAGTGSQPLQPVTTPNPDPKPQPDAPDPKPDPETPPEPPSMPPT